MRVEYMTSETEAKRTQGQKNQEVFYLRGSQTAQEVGEGILAFYKCTHPQHTASFVMVYRSTTSINASFPCGIHGPNHSLQFVTYKKFKST